MPCEAPVTIAAFGVGVILKPRPHRCAGVSATVPLVCGPTPTAIHPPQHESLHAPITDICGDKPVERQLVGRKAEHGSAVVSLHEISDIVLLPLWPVRSIKPRFE